jgi:tRNA (mo5U34)-methyltransferase
MKQNGQPPVKSYSASEMRAQIESLGDWFHNLRLEGVETAPGHFLGDFPNVKWQHLKDRIPADLRGCSVLDIGCNAGFYSLEMKRRGADRVLGIDYDDRYLAQARFASEVSNLDIEYRRMSVYEVGELREKFDIVLFLGVLYHLRYPLLALDMIREHVVRDKLVFQSLMRRGLRELELEPDYPFSEEAIFEERRYPALSFVEHSYSHDPTNWWIPNRACASAMLRSAGFSIIESPEPEMLICQLDPSWSPEAADVDRALLHARRATFS